MAHISGELAKPPAKTFHQNLPEVLVRSRHFDNSVICVDQVNFDTAKPLRGCQTGRLANLRNLFQNALCVAFKFTHRRRNEELVDQRAVRLERVQQPEARRLFARPALELNDRLTGRKSHLIFDGMAFVVKVHGLAVRIAGFPVNNHEVFVHRP